MVSLFPFVVFFWAAVRNELRMQIPLRLKREKQSSVGLTVMLDQIKEDNQSKIYFVLTLDINIFHMKVYIVYFAMVRKLIL